MRKKEARLEPGAASTSSVSAMVSKGISILKPYPEEWMNQVRQFRNSQK